MDAQAAHSTKYGVSKSDEEGSPRSRSIIAKCVFMSHDFLCDAPQTCDGEKSILSSVSGSEASYGRGGVREGLHTDAHGPIFTKSSLLSELTPRILGHSAWVSLWVSLVVSLGLIHGFGSRTRFFLEWTSGAEEESIKVGKAWPKA